MWLVRLLLLLRLVGGVTAFEQRNDWFQTVSKRLLSLSVIRQHLPRINENHLPHIVFEFQHDNLVSHHARLPLKRLAPFTAILSDEKPFTGELQNAESQVSNSTQSYSRHGNGYTFVFDGLSKKLITAWGPSLQLQLINDYAYDGIFLNLGARAGPTTLSPNGTTVDRVLYAMERALDLVQHEESKLDSVKQTACSRQRFFEIGVGYDASFCAAYEDSAQKTRDVLRGLNNHIVTVFRDAACVIPWIISIDGFCRSRVTANGDRFGPPTSFETDCDGNIDNPVCARNSQIMLELSSQEWSKTVSSAAHRDAAFLFTGYGDDTSLAGATYRAAACSDQLSFAWVEGADPVVFAHEVGHMLGAAHDLEGFMTPTVRNGEPLQLSENSKASISRFVRIDPRSWCLEREYDSFGVLQKRYKWETPRTLFYDMNRDLNVSDLTVASPFPNGVSPVILTLVSERSTNGTIGAPALSITATVNISCTSYGSCTLSESDMDRARLRISIPLRFQEGSFGFGIAFAHIQHNSSRDIIISHIRAGNHRNAAALYRIGYDFDDLDHAPQNWSNEHSLPNFFPENVQCSSITAAYIRGGSTPDMLHVHVDRRLGKNVVQYRIGFDIGPDGTARGGWSNGIDIKGWFGRSTTAISMNVRDLDGNGKPELIMYHVDNTPGIKMGNLRVGKDMNSTGHVTGGWTDFIQVPILRPFFTDRLGTMTVADLGGPYPSVVSVQRETQFFTPEAWNLYIGTQVLSPVYLRTAEDRPPLTELEDGCFECYNDTTSIRCTKDMGLCGARVDEVSVEENNPLSSPETDSDVSSAMDDDEIQADPTRPHSPDVNSIYCDGFHYLYSTNQGCDVFDRGTVLAKGVVVAFEKALEEESPGINQNVRSTSLFEEPAGVNDKDRRPIAAETAIYGKNLARQTVINRAISKLSNRPGFSSFIFPRKGVEIIERKNKYLVKFLLKPKHRKELGG